MERKNDGGPVLPEVHKVKRPNSDKTRLQRVPGMRLRDYFAAQAMQGLIANDFDNSRDKCASLSYLMADAMLAARDGIVGADTGRAQLLVALQDCVSVMERELNGLAVIQPELRQAHAALAAAGAQ